MGQLHPISAQSPHDRSVSLNLSNHEDRILIVLNSGGEFHQWRLPVPELWLDILLRLNIHDLLALASVSSSSRDFVTCHESELYRFAAYHNHFISNPTQSLLEAKLALADPPWLGQVDTWKEFCESLD